MSEQRRAVGLIEVKAVGGPLDGLYLSVQRMSDDTFKILGGSIYESIGQYDLHAEAKELRFRGSP